MRELGQQIQPLFTQVLITCDRQGLIGRKMFAIDGVKLPGNASKERSGTHAELRHRAERLDKAARRIIEQHRSQDAGGDEDDAPEAFEQAMLLPMIEQAEAFAAPHTVMTADDGFHSEENLQALRQRAIAAMIADSQMRKRDERFAGCDRYKGKREPLHDKTAKERPIRLFRPADVVVEAHTNSRICPAGQHLYSSGSRCKINGRVAHKFKGTKATCGACTLRAQCLRNPARTPVRQVAKVAAGQGSPHAATELMRRAIDSPRGRRIYSQRIATVEPVFANPRHNKGLNRFTMPGKHKVGTQWRLYCLVHNIEKLGRNGYQGTKG